MATKGKLQDVVKAGSTWDVLKCGHTISHAYTRKPENGPKQRRCEECTWQEFSRQMNEPQDIPLPASPVAIVEEVKSWTCCARNLIQSDEPINDCLGQLVWMIDQFDKWIEVLQAQPA